MSHIPPSSLYQFQWIYSLRNYTHHHHLYQRLKQALGLALYKCFEAQMMFVEEFERIIQLKSEKTLLELTKLETSENQVLAEFAKRRCITDPEVYQHLYTSFHSMILKHQGCKAMPRVAMTASINHTEQNVNRNESRVKFILDLLDGKTDRDWTILDIGCGNGEIVECLAKTLDLNKRALGCDIKPKEQITAEIDYTQLHEQDYKLPYASESCDLVITLMSLHHIAHHMQTLQEIVRILKPDGKLILREHDLHTPYLSVILDIVHGLYDCVFMEKPQQSSTEFCKAYRAYYASREHWQTKLKTVGLLPMDHSPDLTKNYKRPIPVHKLTMGRNIPNMMCIYMGIYQKDSNLNLFCQSKKQKLE